MLRVDRTPGVEMPRRPVQGTPLRSLSYRKHRELAEFLNIAERWRCVIDMMPDGAYSMMEVERFARAMHIPGNSAANALLLDLGTRGITVEQLVSYLRRLQYEVPLLLLLPKAPVSIVTQPQRAMCSINGEFVLSVEATGLPFPKYQWYRSCPNGESEILHGARDRVLRIARAGPRDHGIYWVHVFNDVNNVHSDCCKVEVFAAPAMTPDTRMMSHFGMPPAPMMGQSPHLYPCSAPMPLLRITCQPPPHLTHVEGGSVQIRCDADGAGPLAYEWLANGRVLPTTPRAASDNILSIHGLKVEDTGRYQCRVTLLHQPDQKPLLSGYCELTVEPAQPLPVLTTNPEVAVQLLSTSTKGRIAPVHSLHSQPPSQKLVGKVALVIGNQNYYGDMEMGSLYQTESDAAELASLLTSIDDDFRVISLINLTALEMTAAITLFLSLLGPGVYAVFYFAGHGFRSGGNSYLLPVDIGLEEGPDQCIRAEDILYRMQSKGTKFSFLVLDMCRIEYPHLERALRSHSPAVYSKEANHIIAHSCLPSCMAYERRSEENGIYMTHMKKFLHLNKPVEDVLKEVAKSIAADHGPQVQRPVYTSSTTEDIFLHEEIVYTSEPEEKYLATLKNKWQLVHRTPKPDDEPLYCYHGLRVTLSFHAEFSNVLIACVHATRQGEEKAEKLRITVEPLDADSDGLIVEDLAEKKGSRQRFHQVANLHLRDRVSAPWCYRICGIQKLTRPLCLEFKIQYEYDRTNWDRAVVKEFTAPLVASLNLPNGAKELS